MKKMNVKAWAATAVVWMSYVIFVLSFYFIAAHSVFWLTAESAAGTVLGKEAMESLSTKRYSRTINGQRREILLPQSLAQATIVSFVTSDGNETVFVTDTGTHSGGYVPGDTLTVLYDSDDPENAKIRSFRELYLGPLLLIVLGAATWIVGIVAQFATSPPRDNKKSRVNV